MSAVARYAYLHGLVSVLAERLRHREELDALVEQPAEEVPAFLAAAGLDLPGLPEMDPWHLEQTLIGGLLTESMLLLRPLTGVARDLLMYWLRRFEIGNLKAMLRGKLTGHDQQTIAGELLDLGPMARLPVEELLRTEDAAELLRRLEGTAYGGIARQARAIYEERHDLFTVEATVDRHYFAGLQKRVNGIQDPDRRYLRPLVGSVIDQINLVWLLRYRFAYRLNPPHTYFLLAPGGLHLSSKDLLALVGLDGLAAVLDRLPEPLKGLLAGLTSISAVESAMEEQTRRVGHFALTHTTFNLARALAFMSLREKQLLQIHAILKGRLLHLSPALIRRAAHIPGFGQPAPAP
jgi:V/A-type H+-transporting ATPase subunit C